MSFFDGRSAIGRERQAGRTPGGDAGLGPGYDGRPHDPRPVDAGEVPGPIVRRGDLARLPEDDREVLVMRHLELLRFGKLAVVPGVTRPDEQARPPRAVDRARGASARAGAGGPSR
ncbi:hypothetical protein [Tautonia plasticadhaerens]|uniref:Uncharacterized protein n=1 Tax=Tautonia plasticadhaerens TaxID=2527974 RepID=A0A518GV57_9BACT|nr:hypothetical protein [Tautonia plasticadhaerens]QDV32475.1 hypothetical protein ElP_03080 [Tautonia plasticadhaerens]